MIKIVKKYFLYFLIMIVLFFVGIDSMAQNTSVSVLIPEHWNVAEAIKKGDWDAPPYERRWFSERVRQFQEAHPEIELDFETLGWDQIAPNFVIRSIGKNAPDAAIFDIRFLYPLVQGGYLEPLDTIDDYEEWDDFVDETLNAVSVDGHVYMMPMYHSPVLMYWNKKMFAEAGLVGPPKTWEEFVEFSIKLTKDTDGDGVIDQWGFGTECSNIHKDSIFFFTPFVWSQGGALADEEGHAIFNSPEIKEALQLYVDLVHKYKSAPESMATWDKEANIDAFANGLVAMSTNLAGLYQISKERLGEENIGTAKIPVKNETDIPYTWVETFGFVISKDSENKEAIWEFIKWMGANETLYAAAKYYGTAPSRKSAIQNPIYKSNPILEFSSYYSVEAGHPMPFIKETNVWWDLLGVAMQEAVLGCYKTVEQALNDAQVSYDSKVK